MITFLTPKKVCEQTSLSRASLNRLVASGEFPQPIKLMKRRLAFDAASVQAWMQERLSA